MPRSDLDGCLFADRDAAFEEGLTQSLGATGGAEQNEGLSRCFLQILAEVFEVPAILARWAPDFDWRWCR